MVNLVPYMPYDNILFFTNALYTFLNSLHVLILFFFMLYFSFGK